MANLVLEVGFHKVDFSLPALSSANQESYLLLRALRQQLNRPGLNLSLRSTTQSKILRSWLTLTPDFIGERLFTIERLFDTLGHIEALSLGLLSELSPRVPYSLTQALRQGSQSLMQIELAADIKGLTAPGLMRDQLGPALMPVYKRVRADGRDKKLQGLYYFGNRSQQICLYDRSLVDEQDTSLRLEVRMKRPRLYSGISGSKAGKLLLASQCPLEHAWDLGIDSFRSVTKFLTPTTFEEASKRTRCDAQVIVDIWNALETGSYRNDSNVRSSLVGPIRSLARAGVGFPLVETISTELHHVFLLLRRNMLAGSMISRDTRKELLRQYDEQSVSELLSGIDAQLDSPVLEM